MMAFYGAWQRGLCNDCERLSYTCLPIVLQEPPPFETFSTVDASALGLVKSVRLNVGIAKDRALAIFAQAFACNLDSLTLVPPL